MSLEFGILGPVEVRADGMPLKLGGPKQRALLAIFLLHPNRVLTRERLIELLWGEEPPSSPNNTLQVHLSQLRRVLEPTRSPRGPDPLLVNRPSGYLLAIEPEQLDVHRFEKLRQDGRRALTDDDPRGASRAFHTALALWRGAALADFPEAPFAVAAQTRLEELRLLTLEDRIQADLTLGRDAELVGELQVLVAEHSLSERLSGELMLALYRCGRQAEASEVFQELRRRLVETLGLEPGPDLQNLLTRILNQDPSLQFTSTSVSVTQSRTYSLPVQLTRFVGRRNELEALKGALRESRLVSLLGTAGIGKTRLALRLASQVHDMYPDGVCFTDLAPVVTDDLVAQRALAALGFDEQGGTSPEDTIARRLAKQDVLLVLDNCEHVIDGASELALHLLERCAGLTILATTRERLNIPGERVWRVEPLTVPSEDIGLAPAALMEYEAVELFVDRAQAGERLFVLTRRNAVAVAQLCRRLDGLPLALELAASSSSFATPHDLLELTEARFEWPGRPQRGLPLRQQTLDAAIDWSYRLLSIDEQVLFSRLSVFVDTFTFQAVEQVCADEGLPRAHLPRLMAELVNKSLVAAHERRDGVMRYRLLYTVRQFASIKLTAGGESNEINRRHARHTLWLASASADAVHGPDANAWMQRMEESHADLSAALAWSRDNERDLCLRLAAASALFWEDRGYLTEGRRWLDSALALAGAPSSIEAAAWQANGRLALVQNDPASARTRLEHGLTVAEQARDEVQQAAMLRLLGLAAALLGDQTLATEWQEQSLRIAERLDDEEELANTLHTLGQGARVLGNETGAYTYHTRCLSLARRLHNHRLAAVSNLNVGTLALRRGEFDDAEEHLRECLEIWSWLGGRLQCCVSVASLAVLAAKREQPERALVLLSAAIAFSEQIGTNLAGTARYWFGDDLSVYVDSIRDRLKPAVAASAWEHGHQMHLEDAIVLALAREPIRAGLDQNPGR